MKPPIFGFSSRYESKYTIEELYQLQQKILDLKESTDLEKDLKKNRL